MLKRFPEEWRSRGEQTEHRERFREVLRHRIVGLLHAGHIRPGDRLPSIRKLAAEESLDHRVVASAYRTLEDEGLLAIRSASGVVVRAGGAEEARGPAPESWLAQVLLAARAETVPPARLAELVQRAVVGRRCGCVESNEDHMTAFAAELEADFSLAPVPLYLRPGDAGDAGHALSPEALAEVDLVITSVFHASEATAAAERAGKPVVVATLNPALSRAVEQQLRAEVVTAVHVDEEYAARGRAFFEHTTLRDRVRFVRVEDFDGRDGPGVHLTRAARRRLGLEDFHLVPGIPLLSAVTASEIFATLLRTDPATSPPTRLSSRGDA